MVGQKLKKIKNTPTFLVKRDIILQHLEQDYNYIYHLTYML